MKKKNKRRIKYELPYRIFEVIFELVFILFSFELILIFSNYILKGDFSAGMGSIYTYITSGLYTNFFDLFINYWTTFVSHLFYFIIFFLLFRVFKISIFDKTIYKSLYNTFIAIVTINITFLFLSILFTSNTTTIVSFIVSIFVQFGLLCIFKVLFYRYVRPRNKKYVLIYGTKESAYNISKKFFLDKSNYRLLRYVVIEEEVIKQSVYDSIDKCDYVYLAEDVSTEHKNYLIDHCVAKNKVDIFVIPRLYEIALVEASISQIDDKLTFSFDSLHLSSSRRFLKRTFDILVSLTLLIFSLPFLLLFVLLIKLEDKGPAFFLQERVSVNNKTFKLYKLRSMVVNADKISVDQAQKNDPRITKIGRLIRGLRVDELPQLINVLKGDMSIVGPRPLVRREVDEFIKRDGDFEFRSNVKPGITGLAQALGKYNTTFDDKLRFDLLYIRKQSFFFDIYVLLLTILAIFDKDSTRTGIENRNLDELAALKDKIVQYDGNILKIKPRS